MSVEEGGVVGAPVEDRAFEAGDLPALPSGGSERGEQVPAEPGVGREERPAPGPPARGLAQALDERSEDGGALRPGGDERRRRGDEG